MRLLYSLILSLALPFLFLRLFLRSRHNPDYKKRWSERLGFVPGPKLKGSIWLHAVSLGEAVAATPLIKSLLATYPDTPLVISTTTPVGSAYIQTTFVNRVTHSYIPFDLPWFLNRFLKHTQPKLCIIMETELWPNLIYCTHAKKCALLLASACLSRRSFEGYSRIKFLITPMLNCFDQVAAQTQLDAERFLKLGLDPTKLSIAGNLKFDLQLSDDIKEQRLSLRNELGKNRILWTAASTHEGEEVILLEALKKLKAKNPRILLILAPRHKERFNKVFDLCVAQGFKTARHSLNELPDHDTSIYLIDNFGELMRCYAASDIAFVGGSLVPIGGHNLLEPAALALPIVTGPELNNITEISQLLLANKALLITHNADELSETISTLLNNPAQAKLQGEAALSVVNANRGAVAKHMELIKQHLR